MVFGKIVKKTIINKKEVILRYPKMEDLEGLRELHNKLVQERAFIELQKRMTNRSQLEWFLQIIRKIEKREAVLLILESESRIRGYGLMERFGLAPPAFHIAELNIALSEDVRRKGYGRQLFWNIMREVKRVLRVKIIFIDVAKSNKHALNFFEEMGFKIVGKIKRGFKYYGRYLDDIILVKYL